MSEYVSSLEGAAPLLDKLCKIQYTIENDIKEPLFPCHLTPSQIHDGISSGKLMQGTFYASRENYLEGTVNVEGMEKPVCSSRPLFHLVTIFENQLKQL